MTTAQPPLATHRTPMKIATLISTSEMIASILYHILELIYSENPHFIRFQNYGTSWMKPNYKPTEQHLKWHFVTNY
jgi:hypothetical protein